MAVDVLNRTTGPTDALGERSSFELLVGRVPKVLQIMPFGCRSFVGKPRERYSKTQMEPQAWVGVNLGRSVRSPGAYQVWVPSTGRTVVASDVYFMEHIYPCRPKKDQVDDVTALLPVQPPEPDDPPIATESSPVLGRED